ncbi:hypothetical protein [Mycoplasmopsis felifaucium]|uniref:hypothetical protein n=1 Tax=Mycoplasmopsis felifaucium TaxID=35768 RepID=UPI000488021F|nr:hypothetical protein [Mycoplasmopsis felifaucium]
MKLSGHKIDKNLNIKNVELKKDNEVVADVKMSVPAEIIKFIVLIFTSVFFIMLQYGNLAKSDLLREIYLYSFGLVFGDLMILVLIGSYLTLFIRWASPWFKKHYLKWFFTYLRVDYWTFRKALISFIWLNLLAIAIIYHSVLMFMRIDMHTTFISTNQIKYIYVDGWYKSFTVDGRIANENILPHAYLNVGIYLDSILNLLYVISFSPYLAWVISLMIIAFSWMFLVTLNPKEYFKNLLPKKYTMAHIERYLQKRNFIFYYTEQVKLLFTFYKKCAYILDIDTYKVKFSYLLKQIDKNAELLIKNVSLAKFFNTKKSQNTLKTDEDINFILENNTIKYDSDPDLIIAAANPDSLLTKTKNSNKEYITFEPSREITLKDFETQEVKMFEENNQENFDIVLASKAVLQQNNKISVLNSAQVIKDNFPISIDDNKFDFDEEEGINSINTTEEFAFSIDTNEIVVSDDSSILSAPQTLNTGIQNGIITNEVAFDVDTVDVELKDNNSNEPSFIVDTTEISLDIADDKNNDELMSNELSTLTTIEKSQEQTKPKQQNFDFTFDTSTIIISENDAKTDESENNDWISPILSGRK